MTMISATGGRSAGDRTRPGPLSAHVRGPRNPREERGPSHRGLAQGLGWFSIGLGLAEVLAPRGFARFIGLHEDARTCAALRLIGMRELACGAGLLSGSRPAGWAWARVAGDVIDTALLGSAIAGGARDRGRAVAATVGVVGAATADLYGAVQLEHDGEGRGLARHRLPREIRVRKAVTVNRPAAEVYRFWRDLRNLPRFLQHLQSVEELGGRRSRWRTRGPAGMSIEWEAEITADRPNELIAWRSVEGSTVENFGSVRFVPAPGGRGTEVHVDLHYNPPGGRVAVALARLFGESADEQVYDDLRAFKQVLETGEVLVSEGTLYGRGYWQRPAQPPAELPADWPGLED